MKSYGVGRRQMGSYGLGRVLLHKKTWLQVSRINHELTMN